MAEEKATVEAKTKKHTKKEIFEFLYERRHEIHRNEQNRLMPEHIMIIIEDGLGVTIGQVQAREHRNRLEIRDPTLRPQKKTNNPDKS